MWTWRSAVCTAPLAAGRIEAALRGLAGVQEAQVNFATEKAAVHFDSVAVDRQALRHRIEEAGYGVLDVDAGDPTDLERLARTAEIRDLRAKLLVSLLLGLPVMIGSMPSLFPWAPTWLRQSFRPSRPCHTGSVLGRLVPSTLPPGRP